MFTSLRSRLWLSYALLSGVVLFLSFLGVLIYILVFRSPYETRLTLQRLGLISQVIFQRSDGIDLLDSQQLQAAVERADQSLNVRVIVLSPQGERLADSRAGNPLPDLGTLLKRSATTRPTFRGPGGAWLYVLRQLPAGETLLVAAPRPRTPLITLLTRDDLITPFIPAALLALFLALLLGLVIARWVAAPLQRIADASRRVAAGEYRPIPLEGPSEVQSLAQAFNEMNVRVKASQQSQRDFIANVSHELKTPLTSIQGFAQAILDGAVEAPQGASVIHTEAERMNRLVLELLDLARLDAGTANLERQKLDLSQLLNSLAAKFDPLAHQAQLELCSQIDPLPLMIGDADRLVQVFGNLLDNALKFTPPGGQVTLSVRQSGKWAVVSVADSGPGIPTDEQARIFERFYQTDKSRSPYNRRGVGLGLAIAKGIVKAHGGELSVQSESGKGSVFVVKLPVE